MAEAADVEDAVETEADDESRVLIVRRGDVQIVFNFSDEPRRVEVGGRRVEVAANDFLVTSRG